MLTGTPLTAFNATLNHPTLKFLTVLGDILLDEGVCGVGVELD